MELLWLDRRNDDRLGMNRAVDRLIRTNMPFVIIVVLGKGYIVEFHPWLGSYYIVLAPYSYDSSNILWMGIASSVMKLKLTPNCFQNFSFRAIGIDYFLEIRFEF